jgi:hypothetical protein
MFPEFIHVAPNGGISLLFKAEYYSVVCIHCIFTLCSSIEEPIGWIHILAIVNNAALNMRM